MRTLRAFTVLLRRLSHHSKLVSTIVSTFTAYYVHYWPNFFPDTPLSPPLPSFDGRAVCYPTVQNLRDYMSWRQVDCKYNQPMPSGSVLTEQATSTISTTRLSGRSSKKEEWMGPRLRKHSRQDWREYDPRPRPSDLCHPGYIRRGQERDPILEVRHQLQQRTRDIQEGQCCFSGRESSPGYPQSDLTRQGGLKQAASMSW